MTDYLENLLRILESCFKEQDLLGANSVLDNMTAEVKRLVKLNYCTHAETWRFEEKEVVASFIKTLKDKGALEVKAVGKVIDGMADTYQIKMYDADCSHLKDFLLDDLQGKRIAWMSDEYKKLYK